MSVPVKTQFKTRVLSLILMIVIVFNGIFMFVDINQINYVKAAKYSTPGTGVNWDMDDLVANSNGNVTFESGIYIFHNETTISKNDVLRINPGSILKFEKLTSLRVGGTLIAKGTKNEMITFTQDPTGDKWPEYSPDHWGGLKFFDTCDFEKTIVTFCIIEHAITSIVTFNAPILITDNICNTYFYGISVYGTPPIIRNISFNCTGESSSFEYSSGAKIENSIFTAERYSAVSLFKSDLVINNCTFKPMPYSNVVMKKESMVSIYNTTFDHTKLYFNDNLSKAFLTWHVGIKVIDINNNPISDSRVKVIDYNGTEILNRTTDLYGLTDEFYCIEFEYRDLTEDGDCLDYNERLFHTPHRIIAKKDEFEEYMEDINIEEDRDIIIKLLKPPKLIKEIPDNYFILEDSGDGDNLIDLEKYFWYDYNVKNLSYEIIYQENSSLLSVYTDGNYLDFVQKKENWFGTLAFQIKTIDPNKLECLGNNFSVTVKPTNDPPIINDINGKKIKNDTVQFALVQNEYFNATINVTEIDGERLSFNSNISLQNFDLDQVNGNIVYLPSNADVGIVYGKIKVTDENETNDVVNLTLIIENVNDRPNKPVIIYPSNNDEFKITDFISFNGSCDDLDLFIPDSNEQLKFIWWSDIVGKLGEGKVLRDKLLPVGNHKITLEVLDKAGLGNSTSIFINVLKGESDFKITPPFCTLLNPKNGGIINTFSINLSWETNFTKPDMLTYDIYLDSKKDPTTIIGKKISDTNYFIDGLEDGKTYYWTVIPYLGELEGNCSSGTISFSVDKYYLPKKGENNEGINENTIILIILVIVIVIIIITGLIFIIKSKRVKRETLKPNQEQSKQMLTQSQQYQQQSILLQQQSPLQIPQQQFPQYKCGLCNASILDPDKCPYCRWIRQY